MQYTVVGRLPFFDVFTNRTSYQSANKGIFSERFDSISVYRYNNSKNIVGFLRPIWGLFVEFQLFQNVRKYIHKKRKSSQAP